MDGDRCRNRRLSRRGARHSRLHPPDSASPHLAGLRYDAGGWTGAGRVAGGGDNCRWSIVTLVSWWLRRRRTRSGGARRRSAPESNAWLHLSL